jgi:RecA-family ATPase
MATEDGLNAVKDVLENPVDPGPDAGNISQWDEPMDMGTAIHQTPDPMPWLMSDRVPKGRGIILTGLGGSSKTRCLYSIACGSVIGSLPWDWKIESTGKAVLVLTEDTAQDVHRTVHFMAMDLTDDQKKILSENLITYPLAGKDTRLMVKTSKGTVEKSPLFHHCKKKSLTWEDVVFVGLDPALSVSEGDELDQGHQRALGKMADDLAVQTGATVCLVAHATKGSLIKQELTSHNSRGGGAITDAVRAEYSMRNMTIEEANHAGITDVEERKRHVQLVCTKGNAIPPAAFVPVWLRRDDFGNLAEVDIEMDRKGTLSDQDMDILKVHSEIGAGCPIKLVDWRAECINRGLITGCSENAQNQAMKRVVNKLNKAGLIEKGGSKGLWEQTQ